MLGILAVLYGLTTPQIDTVAPIPVSFRVYLDKKPDYSGWYNGEDVEIYIGGCDNSGCENWIPFIIRNTIPHEMGHIIYSSKKSPELDAKILSDFEGQQDRDIILEKFKSPTYKYTFNKAAEIYSTNFANTHRIINTSTKGVINGN